MLFFFCKKSPRWTAIGAAVATVALVFICSAVGFWLFDYAQPGLTELNVTADADEVFFFP